jgi:tight adherence protein B
VRVVRHPLSNSVEEAMLLKLSIFGLVFSSVGVLVWQYSASLVEKLVQYQTKKVEEIAKQLDNMFIKVPANKLFLIYTLTPLGLGGIGFLVSGKIAITIILLVFGLVLPTIVIKWLDTKRKNRFQDQLVDGLMILGSSLKGGLSLLQSIEAMVEGMSPPISQEFSLVLRENKLGISLDESLERLNKRMSSEELNLIVTAISVARETGGELPQIFSQLIHTIREKTKLLGKVKTLTIQGKLQGFIMSFLPIGFSILVYSMNPGYFNIMIENDLGRALLGYAFIAQVLGIFLIRKFSKVEV